MYLASSKTTRTLRRRKILKRAIIADLLLPFTCRMRALEDEREGMGYMLDYEGIKEAVHHSRRLNRSIF